MRCYITVEVRYYKQEMKKWHFSLVSNFSIVNIFCIADNVKKKKKKKKYGVILDCSALAVETWKYLA